MAIKLFLGFVILAGFLLLRYQRWQKLNEELSGPIATKEEFKQKLGDSFWSSHLEPAAIAGVTA